MKDIGGEVNVLDFWSRGGNRVGELPNRTTLAKLDAPVQTDKTIANCSRVLFCFHWIRLHFLWSSPIFRPVFRPFRIGFASYVPSMQTLPTFSFLVFINAWQWEGWKKLQMIDELSGWRSMIGLVGGCKWGKIETTENKEDVDAWNEKEWDGIMQKRKRDVFLFIFFFFHVMWKKTKEKKWQKV